jgi:hypothetical protein
MDVQGGFSVRDTANYHALNETASRTKCRVVRGHHAHHARITHKPILSNDRYDWLGLTLCALCALCVIFSENHMEAKRRPKRGQTAKNGAI